VRATPTVDILVNNLGIYEIKDFAAITDADWRRYFEVNVLSGARLARAYFPGMLERNWVGSSSSPVNRAWSRWAK
jgi:NAD(P)-dependent dehydrogenase (short-subunit alcohol dehydrogenase family)